MTGTPPEFASGFGRSLFDGLDGIWGLAGGCATAGRCGGGLIVSLGGSLKQIMFYEMRINSKNEVVLQEKILKSLNDKREAITATRMYASKRWTYIKD